MTEASDGSWEKVNSELGEALLDVERTLITLAEAHENQALPGAHRAECFESYLVGWRRLEAAHRDFRIFMAAHAVMVMEG